jgi:hypothetical protein
MQYIDAKHKGEMDLKFKLTSQQLISLIGSESFTRLVETSGMDPEEIWLRRAETNGPHQGINWHVDHSVKTMQVALNGDNDYKGGKLVFAANNKIYVPERPAGTASVHNCNIVHGVTPMISGPRYGLFFLRLPQRAH